MVDPIPKTLRFPTVSIANNPMFLFPPAENWCGLSNFLAIISFFIGLLSLFVLFGFSTGSVIGLSMHGGFCYLLSRLPQQSRLTLLSHKKAKKEESVKELLKKL